MLYAGEFLTPHRNVHYVTVASSVVLPGLAAVSYVAVSMQVTYTCLLLCLLACFASFVCWYFCNLRLAAVV